jgi:hypothetical protein
MALDIVNKSIYTMLPIDRNNNIEEVLIHFQPIAGQTLCSD